MIGRKPLSQPKKTEDFAAKSTPAGTPMAARHDSAPEVAPVEEVKTFLSDHKLSGENLNTCFQKMEDCIVLRDTRLFASVIDSFLLVFELELASTGKMDQSEKGLMWRVNSLQRAAKLFRIASLRMGSGDGFQAQQKGYLDRFVEVVIAYVEALEPLVARDVAGAEGWLRMKPGTWRIRRFVGETLSVLSSISQEVSETDGLNPLSVMRLKNDRNDDILLWIFISFPDFAAHCDDELRKKLKAIISGADSFLDKKNFSILERPELHSLDVAQIYEVLAVAEQARLLAGSLDTAESR